MMFSSSAAIQSVGFNLFPYYCKIYACVAIYQNKEALRKFTFYSYILLYTRIELCGNILRINGLTGIRYSII